MAGEAIPVRAVGTATHAHPREAPYRLFIATSLALALGGGFMLAVLVPLAHARGWAALAGVRGLSLTQAHGQLQLLGFAGLFVMGMALRLVPRVSGRPLTLVAWTPAIAPLVATSVVARFLAQPMPDGAAGDVALVASAALLLAAAALFWPAVVVTALGRGSRAEATGWCFALGATAYAAAGLNAAIVAEMVRDSLASAPIPKQDALIFVELFGVLMAFIGGVATRALPTMSGRPRPDRATRAAVVALGASVAAGAVALLLRAYDAPGDTSAPAFDGALLGVAAALVAFAWLSGVIWMRADRVAAASRPAFWLARAGMAWLLAGAALLAWYAGWALADGTIIGAFEMDAVRHTLTVGVVTTMIAGMALLIVPEFAGRRLQHPGEGWLLPLLAVALSAATALRVWPAVAGIDWVEATRYWPMFAAGSVAIVAVGLFAAMFGQSWWEQRRPGWASAEALAERGRVRNG